ncbi:MAG: hypothetical protein EHM35_19435 [Planctomycetaceae bacterium]|nr:MAG: hypothetical protein EHM35_19435 [Planctomycetaceae bacterium]
MTDTSWYPINYYIQPHYKTMPEYLRVEDAAIMRLTGTKRQLFWKRCRDSGLAEWAPTGINLKVQEVVQGYRRQRVTLNLADTQTGGDASHCFEDCEPCFDKTACDWIHIKWDAFEQCFQARNSGKLKYWVAHEFGHSLGFGHGGDGIMDETPDHAVVNDEEIAAAKDYWDL